MIFKVFYRKKNDDAVSALKFEADKMTKAQTTPNTPASPLLEQDLQKTLLVNLDGIYMLNIYSGFSFLAVK